MTGDAGAGKGPLSQGTGYLKNYTAAPTCQLDLSFLTAASRIGPNEHLIIYPINSVPYNQKRQVWDQFKGGILTNFRSYFLAVPTLKTKWEPLE